MTVATQDGFVKLKAPEEIVVTGYDLATESGRNAHGLELELTWLRQILEVRLALYFENDTPIRAVEDVLPPDQTQVDSAYGRIIERYQLGTPERLGIALALAPHLKPQVLNLLLIRDQTIDRPFVEFGGWQGKFHQGFLPTGETLVFLLAGANLQQRLSALALFERDHAFSQHGILDIKTGEFDEAFLTAPLTITNEYFHLLTSGRCAKPDFSRTFPAKLIHTNLDWDDLVVPAKVSDELDHIKIWLQNQHQILNNFGLNKNIQPGYRALFYGPPGTGKTLTASLLGKALDMDVYRIDLSAVVSKYIGETEKNLESVFSQAEKRQWILFFDEADALFGKRTEANSANDRHANQEVAYLLQRIENFPGIIVLATNLKANIDDAFHRRFQSMTYFPMPDTQLRHILWKNAFKHSDLLSSKVNLEAVAKQSELSGGAIANVVRYAVVRMLKEKRKVLSQEDISLGIQKEMKKQGRVTG